jgi:hypothetical protein
MQHTKGREFRYIGAGDPYITWSPPKKKRELFHKHSRFILLENEDQLAAFCMFRFEAEENDKGVTDFIIYMWVILVFVQPFVLLR